MLHLTLVFLVFSVLLIRKDFSDRSTQFLCLIIFSWILSLSSLILYLTRHNFYNNIITQLFNLGPGVWQLLTFNPLGHDFIILCLNVGVVLFNYSVLCYALAFTRPALMEKSKRVFLLVAIVPLVQLIWYDQYLFKLWYPFVTKALAVEIQVFNQFEVYAAYVFRSMNLFYLVSAFILLLWYYRQYPKVRFLSTYSLYISLCLMPSAVVHFLMFSWAPRRLIRITVVRNHYNYMVPDLEGFVLFYRYLPYIVFIASPTDWGAGVSCLP